MSRGKITQQETTASTKTGQQRSCSGHVVEDEQVGRTRGQRIEKRVLRREREERELELLGRQGLRRAGDRGDDLIDEGRGRQEGRDPRGHRRPRKRVHAGERSHGRVLVKHGGDEVGRDGRVEVRGRVQREEVREETSGVGGGHRRARKS